MPPIGLLDGVGGVKGRSQTFARGTASGRGRLEPALCSVARARRLEAIRGSAIDHFPIAIKVRNTAPDAQTRKPIWMLVFRATTPMDHRHHRPADGCEEEEESHSATHGVGLHAQQDNSHHRGNTGPQASRMSAEVAARAPHTSASISATQATPSVTRAPARWSCQEPASSQGGSEDGHNQAAAGESKPEAGQRQRGNSFARASGTSGGVCRRTSVVAQPAVDVSSGTKNRKANPRTPETGSE